MSRPPGAPPEPFIDAVHAARSGLRLERRFGVEELPRLRDASLSDGSVDSNVKGTSHLNATFTFSLLEGHPVIGGEMSGSVQLLCQRCLQPVAVPIAEDFRIVLVSDEDAPPEEFGGYEPVAVDASRVDLQWLAEEQALLALPLVPLHEPGECAEAVEAVNASMGAVVEETVAPTKQKPFGNLRELMQKR